MLSGCAFLLLVPPAERTLKHNRDSRVFVEKERKRMRRKERREGMVRAHVGTVSGCQYSPAPCTYKGDAAWDHQLQVRTPGSLVLFRLSRVRSQPQSQGWVLSPGIVTHLRKKTTSSGFQGPRKRLLPGFPLNFCPSYL